MVQQFQRSELLRNIPENKLIYCKNKFVKNCKVCSLVGHISCDDCFVIDKALSRYYEANIPIDFWHKYMEKHFNGDLKLKNLYDEIRKDIPGYINEGQSFLIKGMHGTGKTFISSMILKKIVEVGYFGLYTTLGDLVSIATSSDYKGRADAARELKMLDFLVIDEFDPRFFSSDASAELYGRVLEAIIRIRFQNKLPTVLVTNNPDPTKAFGDALGASIGSLISGYCKEIFIIGPDKRKQ